MPQPLAQPPSFGAPDLDESLLNRLIDAVNARIDSADHRMLLLLRILYTTKLPEPWAQRARQAVTSFRYSLHEPGQDAMVCWTENHQLSFAVCEYLAGQLYPEVTFLNDGRSGKRHRNSGHARLQMWLADRFRFGLSEWLSNTYLAYDVASLTLLADHAEDESLVTRASMVLDLVLLDAALHSFETTLAATAGRGGAQAYQDPTVAPMSTVLACVAGNPVTDLDPGDLSVIFATRQRYQIPAAITELARGDEHRQVTSSQGLDVAEVPIKLAQHPDYPRTDPHEWGRFWWGMQAITTRETIVAAMDFVRGFGLASHPVFVPLTRFLRLPRQLLPKTVTALNPITAGTALQRAEIQTFRTPNYLLSSVQRYQPGEFGDQQHLWHARLRGNINVFGTHPGSSAWAREVRATSPSNWVGNGINPDIAQDGNILLAVSNLNQRHGYLEGRRLEKVHFYFPFVAFDQTRIGPHWVAGRRGNGYVGIVGTHQLEQVSEDEVVMRGTLTGYSVVMGDDEEFGSIAAFVKQLRQHVLTLHGTTLRLVMPYGSYELTWRGKFVAGTRVIESHYPRYDTAAVRAGRDPREIHVQAGAHRLDLDWQHLSRVSS